MSADNARLTPITIPDDELGIDRSNHSFPPEYQGHLESVILTREQILDRTRDLAKLIREDYNQERIVLVCVLKGASPFYHDLKHALQDLHQGYDMEFLRVKSYEGVSNKHSEVKISVNGLDVEKALTDKHVLLVEDILDTGKTLSHLFPFLWKHSRPKSLECCTLLQKRIGKDAMAECKYKGFSIPNHFIVGYGIDYNEMYRDLRDIWVVSQVGIDFDASSL